MADEIRLVTYANQQVTPQNDAVLTNLETPNNGIIFGCEISIKNASTLHINSGMGVIYGREFEIVDSDISVPLPGAGTEVGQLYIHIDLANTSEPIQILVETGASLTPMVDDANLNVTTGITEYQLATFNVSTATISDLVVTFENTKDIRTELGDADISGIGDGSVKGAISQINSDLTDTENDLTGKIIASLIPTTNETRGRLLNRAYGIINNLNLDTPHMANIKLVYGGHIHTMVDNNNNADYRFMFFATSASGIEVARLVASAGTSVWNVSTIKADGSGISTSDIANQVATATLHIVC